MGRYWIYIQGLPSPGGDDRKRAEKAAEEKATIHRNVELVEKSGPTSTPRTLKRWKNGKEI